MAELASKHVAATYARALFEAAKDVGKIDLINEEMQELVEILDGDHEFKEVVESPVISIRRKKKMLEAIFEGRLEEETLNFLYILLDKGRIHHFDLIAKTYKEEVSRYEGYASGTILTATALEEEQLAHFEEQTSKLFRKKVRLHNEIDPSIIGGVKIFLEGKIIDATVKQQLDSMLRNIKK